jgi:hypothetical protein
MGTAIQDAVAAYNARSIARAASAAPAVLCKFPTHSLTTADVENHRFPGSSWIIGYTYITRPAASFGWLPGRISGKWKSGRSDRNLQDRAESGLET